MSHRRRHRARVDEPGGGATHLAPARRRARKADRLVWLVLAFLVVYAVFLARGSYAFSQYRGPTEIFPFFHWELFSRVPEPVQDNYGIRFTAMYGETLDEPVYFEQSVLPANESSNAFALIQQIGSAVQRDDDASVAEYRSILESRFVEPLSDAEYELVLREYDIEERYECECFRSEVVLDDFTVGQP